MPTRTVRPASELAAASPVLLWSSPLRGLVVSCIVGFLSTPVYPESPSALRAVRFGFANAADRAAVLLGDLLDRELGGRDDRADVVAVARVLGPAHQEVAGAAAPRDLDV